VPKCEYARRKIVRHPDGFPAAFASTLRYVSQKMFAVPPTSSVPSPRRYNPRVPPDRAERIKLIVFPTSTRPHIAGVHTSHSQFHFPPTTPYAPILLPRPSFRRRKRHPENFAHRHFAVLRSARRHDRYSAITVPSEPVSVTVASLQLAKARPRQLRTLLQCAVDRRAPRATRNSPPIAPPKSRFILAQHPATAILPPSPSSSYLFISCWMFPIARINCSICGRRWGAIPGPVVPAINCASKSTSSLARRLCKLEGKATVNGQLAAEGT